MSYLKATPAGKKNARSSVRLCRYCGAPLDNPRGRSCDACKAEARRRAKHSATKRLFADKAKGKSGLYALQCKIARALGRPVPPKPGARRACRVPMDAATHTHRNADGATVTSRGTFGWSGQ